MCLAVPMKLVDVNGGAGSAESSGVRLRVELSLVPDAMIGDYVLVHAGYALTVIDEHEARETIELLRALGEVPQ